MMGGDEMYTVAVVDDDIDQARSIARMVGEASCARLLDDAMVVHPHDLPAWLDEGHRADILLTDIRLEDGMPDGTDVVERYFPKGSGTQVIYVTGYASEYLSSVYRTEHVYLVEKPVGKAALEAALAKACRKLDESMERPFAVQFGRTTHVLSPKKIVCAESVGRKLRITTDDGTVETYMKIDDLEALLPRTFCHCHKSFLANLERVASIEGLFLAMDDGSKVPISKGRRQQVRSALVRCVRQLL